MRKSAMHDRPSQDAAAEDVPPEDWPGCLWEELGLKPPVYRDERLAPEVDRELLLKLVRKELPERSARATYWLIYSFRSWKDAHAEILVAEFRRTFDYSALEDD